MSGNTYVIIQILIMAGMTAGLRFLPFLVFARRTPAALKYLGTVLPYSIIAMLVVYCLKDVNLLAGTHGLPEAVSIVLVVLLHKWKHNTLLSIVAGTACYVLLQMV